MKHLKQMSETHKTVEIKACDKRMLQLQHPRDPDRHLQHSDETLET
jgi:hypothetical protein